MLVRCFGCHADVPETECIRLPVSDGHIYLCPDCQDHGCGC